MAQYRTVTEFLRKIRETYDEARKEYTVLNDRLDNLNNSWKAELKRGWSDNEDKKADTERYNKIRTELKNQINELLKNTNAKFDAIKNDCDDVFSIYDRATGDKVDLATVELLKSDILRDDEVKALAKDFEGNCAMLRIIGNYAYNKGAKENNSELRAMGVSLKAYRFNYGDAVSALIYLSQQALREDRGLADCIAKVYDEQANDIFSSAAGISVKVSE